MVDFSARLEKLDEKVKKRYEEIKENIKKKDNEVTQCILEIRVKIKKKMEILTQHHEQLIRLIMNTSLMDSTKSPEKQKLGSIETLIKDEPYI